MREVTNQQTRPIQHLISHRLRRALDAVLMTACVLFLSAATAAADQSGSQETRIVAALSGAAIGGVTPKGDAEFRQRADGRRSLEVEVEHVNLPAGAVLNVLVDNQQVGQITLGAFGSGQIELETENDQTFPLVNSRTRVVVTDQTGNTIVAGAFGDITPTPTPTPGATPTPSPGPTPGATPTPTPNGEVRIEARLAGAAINGLTPTGHAKFRSRNNGQQELEVEVEHVNLPAGTVLSVLVDGAQIGQITLATTLEGEFEVESERGASVPNVTTASTIVVTNAQGQTVLSGAFNSGPTTMTAKANDIDDANFFVSQQYQDFLEREADDSGLDFWKGEIEHCGGDDACVQRARVNTSGAFFLSIEFQETGFMIYLFSKETTGAMPRRNDFLVQMQAAAQGVVVGHAGWEQKLEDNKRSVAAAWVASPEFHARFDGLSDDRFVDALFANAGMHPSQAERDGLVAGLSAGTETRATVLRKVSDDAQLRQQEQNRAFVLMQYFGYLHRNPDEGPDVDMSGYNFWLRKLDDNGGDFQKAEMVKAFIESGEYRHRFDW
ncbi:MAG TPA: DUF4214 domain-containing protein [Pyrinomonadaceae bacterium]|nr:DUF4214 domain-containing protein [Pyrinomonadaceae bacterium]